MHTQQQHANAVEDQYCLLLYRGMALHPDEEHSHLYLYIMYFFSPNAVIFSLSTACGLSDVSCFLYERWSLEIKRIRSSRLITDEG